MSAPAYVRRPIDPAKEKLWVNPCGFEETHHDSSDLPDVGQLSNTQMINNIVLQADLALTSVQDFKRDFVRETFNKDFEEHHKMWERVGQFDWLFRVPKRLGIATELAHLQNLQLDEFLPTAYQYLQKMAVAMEQVAWDYGHPDHHSAIFKAKFNDIEYKLRAVLCEIQNAMIQRNLDPIEIIDRDIMTDEFRYMDAKSRRDFRDWYIFREYMIVLEYIKEGFQFFLDNPSKIPS